MRSISAMSWITGIVLLAGCAPLPDVTAGICGNRVVEGTEECDGPSPEGFACRSQDQSNPCRYACSETVACRPGYLCGAADGVCRAPKGEFGDPIELVSRGALRLLSADMDGSAPDDLIAVTRTGISVYYLDTSGRVASSFEIPALPTMPVIGNISSDGLTDLALNAQEGISLMRGRQDRSFDPTVYSTIPLPPGTRQMVFGDALPDSSDEEVLLIVNHAMTNSTVMLGTSVAEQGVPTKLLEIPNDTGTLAEHVAVARIAPAGPCPHVAMALEGETYFVLFEPCVDNKTWNKDFALPSLPRIDLPADRVAWGGVFAVNIDEDVLLELAVGTQEPGGGGKRLDFFEYQPPPDPPEEPPPGNLVWMNAWLPVLPKADICAAPGDPSGALVDDTFKIGDVNGDGISDFFDRYGIVGTNPASPVSFTREDCPDEPSWDSLILARINVDEYPDWVMVPTERNAVLAFVGTPSNVPNVFTYAMDTEVKEILAGDFDGDVVTDIAVRQAASGAGTSDRLSILFGRAAGAPDPPVEIGELEGIQQVAVARTISGDGLDDLIVSSNVNGDQTAAVLPGNSARQIQSPYLFYTGYSFTGPNGMTLELPVRSLPKKMVGLRLSTDDRDDIVVLAEEEEPGTNRKVSRFWVAESVGEFDFQKADIMGLPNFDESYEEALSIAVLNLRAPRPEPQGSSVEDTDELIVFTRKNDGVDQILKFASEGGAVSFSSEDLDGAGALLLSSLEPDVSQQYSAPISVDDIDGDGLQDIAITTLSGELLVFWNEADARAITAGNRMQMTLPFLVEGLQAYETILDMAFVELDGLPPKEVACLMPDGLRVVELMPRESSEDLLVSEPRRPASSAEPASITEVATSGSALAALDANSDGLTDLVIAGKDNISLLLSTPNKP